MSVEKGGVLLLLLFCFVGVSKRHGNVGPLSSLDLAYVSHGKITLAHPFPNPMLKRVTCSTCQGECSYLDKDLI